MCNSLSFYGLKNFQYIPTVIISRKHVYHNHLFYVSHLLPLFCSSVKAEESAQRDFIKRSLAIASEKLIQDKLAWQQIWCNVSNDVSIPCYVPLDADTQ